MQWELAKHSGLSLEVGLSIPDALSKNDGREMPCSAYDSEPAQVARYSLWDTCIPHSKPV